MFLSNFNVKNVMSDIEEKVTNCGFIHVNHICNNFAISKASLFKSLKEYNTKLEVDDVGYISVKCSLNEFEFLCAPGIIIKICPKFGFIEVNEPIKTKVYFNLDAYAQNHTGSVMQAAGLLTDFDLSIGQEVRFNAKIWNKQYKMKDDKSKYYATKVWVLKNELNEMQHETGKDKCEINGCGVVNSIFPDYGFITFKNEENSVYFSKNVFMTHFDSEVLKDLREVLKKGSVVEFTAVKVMHKNSKSQWEATEVWIKESKCLNNENINEQYKENQVEVEGSKRKLVNQQGEISYEKEQVQIKCGSDIVLVNRSCQIYYGDNKIRIDEITWELDEGTKIMFDAIKLIDNWEAVLIWTRKKPKVYISRDIKSNSNSEISNTHFVTSSAEQKYRKPKYSFCQTETVKSKDNNKCEHDKIFHSKKYEMQGHKLTKKLGPNLKLKTENIEQKLSKKQKTKTSNYINSIRSSNHNFNSSNKSKKMKTFSISNDETNDELVDFFSNSKHGVTNTNNLNEMEFNLTFNNEWLPNIYSPLRVLENLEGEITKVCGKIAELQSATMNQGAIFCLEDLYIDGVAAKEQHYELENILKIGDSVHFNCFETIDETGKSHQKITVVWKGKKSPEEHINENDIKAENSFKTEYRSNNHQVSSNNQSELQEGEFLRNDVKIANESKYSTSYQVVSSPLNSMQKMSSSSDTELQQDKSRRKKKCNTKINKPEKFLSACSTFPSKMQQNDILIGEEASFDTCEEVPLHLQELSDDIYKLFLARSPDFPNFKSADDFDDVSTEIVDLFINTLGTEEFDNFPIKKAPLVRNISQNQDLEWDGETFHRNQQIEETDSYTQTLITGNITFSAIFTQ